METNTKAWPYGFYSYETGSVTVFQSDPLWSGLYNAEGDPLYCVTNRIGFPLERRKAKVVPPADG